MARKRTQKKSSNGVWVGTGISLAILAFIVFALYMKMQPDPPDRASGAITEDNLAKQTLKTSGLPSLGEAPGGSGSFAELLTTIDKSENVMRAGGFDDEKDEKAGEIVQALHGAVSSGLPANALDAKIPPKYFESPDLKRDLQVLGTAVSRQIKVHIDKFEFDEAQGVAVSYLNLGQQVFEKNVRLKSRQRGLAMMRSALRSMGTVNKARYDDGEIDKVELKTKNGKVMAWNNAISELETAWNNKLKPTEAVNASKRIPNTADLVKIAKEDQDPTFRIWASRRLGYALYERGDKGNQKVLNAAIEELKNDSNKQVAKAATEGASIKDSDEYYELRK